MIQDSKLSKTRSTFRELYLEGFVRLKNLFIPAMPYVLGLSLFHTFIVSAGIGQVGSFGLTLFYLFITLWFLLVCMLAANDENSEVFLLKHCRQVDLGLYWESLKLCFCISLFSFFYLLIISLCFGLFLTPLLLLFGEFGSILMTGVTYLASMLLELIFYAMSLVFCPFLFEDQSCFTSRKRLEARLGFRPILPPYDMSNLMFRFFLLTAGFFLIWTTANFLLMLLPGSGFSRFVGNIIMNYGTIYFWVLTVCFYKDMEDAGEVF